MGVPPERESLDRLFAQVSRLHHRRAHTLLDALGLYRGQPPLLRVLWERDGRTLTELAQRLHLQPATITRTIQRTDRTGFVERRPDSLDQRVSRVFLTPAGWAIESDARHAKRTVEGETFAGLTGEERAWLRRSLTQMRENLIRANEEKPPGQMSVGDRHSAPSAGSGDAELWRGRFRERPSRLS